MENTRYYHGGVPGKQPGDHILPAAAMGCDYTAAYRHTPGVVDAQAPYRPDRAYFTTHLGSARGYAARYVTPHRSPLPGDVYIVDLTSAHVEPDPDFDSPKTAGAYVATKTPARIVAVVERGVRLNRREQNRECWPYLLWNDFEAVHTRTGTVRASQEMRGNGVTDDYLALLPKWIHYDEFANDGRLWAPGRPGTLASPDQVLDIVAHLALDTGPHLISSEHVTASPLARNLYLGYFHCQACGQRFGRPNTQVTKEGCLDAVVHQAGAHLRLIAEFNGGLDGYAHALRRRSPNRWKWVNLR